MQAEEGATPDRNEQGGAPGDLSTRKSHQNALQQGLFPDPQSGIEPHLSRGLVLIYGRDDKICLFDMVRLSLMIPIGETRLSWALLVPPPTSGNAFSAAA